MNNNRWLTFSREAQLATFSDHRPRCARYVSLNIDKFAMRSRLQDLRNIPRVWPRCKYVSRLVGETSLIRVSSSHFCANYILAGAYLVPWWIKTRLLKRVFDRSIFHPVCPLRRIHRSSSAWISVQLPEEPAINDASLDKRRRPVDEWSIYPYFCYRFYSILLALDQHRKPPTPWIIYLTASLLGAS